MEEDKEFDQKKELLSKEIIEKEYDMEKFIQFCIEKKPNGDDLSLWTIPELKEIINEFILLIDKKKEKEKEKQSEDILDKEIDKLLIEPEELEPNTQKIIEIPCKKLTKTKLNDIKDLTILIKNPKQIETGLLSSNYVNYEVETSKMNWLVQRRFSDFEWLNNTLTKFFPSYIIPPIPKKKIGKKRFELEFIEKRMNHLQKFLNLIIENEDFKASECLIDFLSIDNRIQFEAKMKEYISFNPSPFLAESRNIEGNVSVWDINIKSNFFDNMDKFYKIENDILDNLNSHFKDFFNNIEKVCNNLCDIQKDFESLFLINSKVSMEKHILRNYEEIGIFIKNWNRIIIKRKDIFKNNFKNFFKFVKIVNNSNIEFLERKNEIKNKYNIEKEKLKVKMEKLFETGDPNKFEIEDMSTVDTSKLKNKDYAFSKMCTKENNNVYELQCQYGYYNNMCFNELMNQQRKNSIKYMNNIKDFMEKLYPTITDEINVYSSLQIFVNTIS